jgi:hypothetical protein
VSNRKYIRRNKVRKSKAQVRKYKGNPNHVRVGRTQLKHFELPDGSRIDLPNVLNKKQSTSRGGGELPITESNLLYVKYNKRLSTSEINEEKSKYGLTSIKHATKRTDLIPSAANVVIVEGGDINQIRRNPNVVLVERVPIYEPFPVEEGEDTRESINLQQAIDEFGNGSYYPLFTNNEMVDYNHPDLIDRVDFDLPLFLNPNGWNVNIFLNNNYQHGTHTAGTVMGHSLDVGTTNARLAFGTKTFFDTPELLEHLVENNIKIMSESYGSTYYSQTEADARLDAYNNGLMMIAAAGNDSSELGVQRNQYPCMYEGVMCVGCNCSNSNYSSEYVNISAPYNDTSTQAGPTFFEMFYDWGGDYPYSPSGALAWICETSLAYECDACDYVPNGGPISGADCNYAQVVTVPGLNDLYSVGGFSFGNYVGGDSWVHPGNGETVQETWYTHSSLGGTSMSTPQVASVALLLLSHNQDLTPDEIWDILVTTGDTDVGYFNVQGPKVNAYEALSYMYDNYMEEPIECIYPPTDCYIDDEVLTQPDNIEGLPGVCVGHPSEQYAGIPTPYYCDEVTKFYCNTISDCPG